MQPALRPYIFNWNNMYDLKNELFGLAADLILNTSRSVFLSGNAGTGKTTFLKYIQEHADKRLIVAAPTGVAAINAGGVTLHSLFQLPFEPFTPNYEGQKILNYQVRFHKSKINLLRQLELLVIDEVSMLRADMLDAIDTILRRFRNSPLPFGGVQMLFIGDLYQLPPVLQEQDLLKLQPYYESPFFFHAFAMNSFDMLHINLKKIYRQEEQTFIDILNRIRHDNVTDDDLQILNNRYILGNLSQYPDYILLSTHNYKVDRINKQELERLSEREYLYLGKSTGDFPDHSLPTDKELRLKKGARVMFTKNDTSDKQAYYNGKIGVVESLTASSIVVHATDGSIIQVSPESWKNIRYSLNAETGEIKEEETGTYTQYPLRLAWAITIHKSQGLTFDRVAVDLQQAFAAGQVYVALSRCRSLDGLLLFSPITRNSIATDPQVALFSAKETETDILHSILDKEKTGYCAERLLRAFDWQPVILTLNAWLEWIREKAIPDKTATILLAQEMLHAALEQQIVAGKFKEEIKQIIASPQFLTDAGINYLKERTQKAVIYFHQVIWKELLNPLDEHILRTSRKARVKLYIKKTQEFREGIFSFLHKLETIRFGNLQLTQELMLQPPTLTSEKEEAKTPAKEKVKKGESARITLTLFREGNDVASIAKERNMAIVTIEGHLADMVASGELAIKEIMTAERLQEISQKLPPKPLNRPLSDIKSLLGNDYSYGEIKLVLSHIKQTK